MADTSTLAEDATRHWHSLYSTAFCKTGNRHDAEDLVQETYLRACRRFEGFREGTNIAAWLQRILANAFIDSYRSRQRRPSEVTLDGIGHLYGHARVGDVELAGVGTSAEDEMLDRTCGEIAEEVRRLPASFRLTVQLADLSGFSYKEIAEQLDVPIGTITSRLHRGRRVLRRQLRTKGLV
jgi:RNA polymerase sigma-70 factor, ECF subfamily